MMKHWLLMGMLLTAVCRNSRAEVEWLTDVPTALQRAARENKNVLLDFTGSDWCGWCMKLKREVFDQDEFLPYAQANLIMVEVDFPRHKEISEAQKAANYALAGKYGIKGYPTIIVLDAAGNKIGRGGYVEGGPKNFIAALERMPGFERRAVAQSKPEPEPPRHAPPEFVPIPPAVPNPYADLALKGISGLKDHRLVMINDQTMMTGETARVKVHDQRVAVTLKEIRDNSVLVVVDGATRELKLAEH